MYAGLLPNGSLTQLQSGAGTTKPVSSTLDIVHRRRFRVWLAAARNGLGLSRESDPISKQAFAAVGEGDKTHSLAKSPRESHDPVSCRTPGLGLPDISGATEKTLLRTIKQPQPASPGIRMWHHGHGVRAPSLSTGGGLSQACPCL